MQRAQIVRPWLVLERLRPVRPRHLANIEVAVRIHGQPVRREEFRRAHAWPHSTQPGDALAGMVDDRHAWSEIWNVAADRLHCPKLADIADRALAWRHEKPARPVQIV